MTTTTTTIHQQPPLLVRGSGKLAAPRPRQLLAHGNQKIGKRIYAFNLPAVDTCPGMSEACQSCYAQRGRWLFPNVQAALERNWEATRDPFFAERLIAEINRREITVVRIHSSGDFFSVGYIRKWATVARNCSGTTFYAYTRSWRLDGLRAALEEQLVPCPNVRLWYSADADTGYPDDVPCNVRVAWLQQSIGETVPDDSDLIFRVHRLRREPAKRIGLTVVCPMENGVTLEAVSDCGRCRKCWK